MDPRRQGMALALAVLVLLALGTVSSGLLYVSLQHARISRAEEELLSVRLAAESGVRTALSRWQTREFRGLAVGEVERTVASAAGRRQVTAVERLAGPLYLLWTEVVVGRTGARARGGVLVRALGVAELRGSFPAAVTLGGTLRVEDGGRVEGFPPGTLPPAGTEAACPAAVFDYLDSTSGGAGVPPILRPDPDTGPSGEIDPPGQPAGTGPESFASFGVGPLGPELLAAIADRIATGSLRPRPALAGDGCDTGAPGNWGAPLEPAAACGDYFPLIFAPDDLRIDGGAGQGMLVVAGDLTLTGGARFDGPVIVGGELTVQDESAIFGAATVAGDVTVRGMSRIASDPCAVWRALDRAPALNRPFRAGARFWLPLF